MKKQILAVSVLLAGAGIVWAQKPVEHVSGTEIEARIKTMLEQSKTSPTHNASETIMKFDNTYELLGTRLGNGLAEYHESYDDIFVVMEGEATIQIGGTITDMHPLREGEQSGTHIDGGRMQPMRKGDVLRIPARVAHQTMVEQGKKFIYLVVKVPNPK